MLGMPASLPWHLYHGVSARYQTDSDPRVSLASERGKEVFGKDHSSHETRQHTAPCSGPSYLPDGREFAIVTVKPPKGYKDREQKMRRSIRGQQLGGGLPRNGWLCEIQQQNHAPWPTFPSPDEGSGAKQAGDRLSAALIPRLQVTIPRTLASEVHARKSAR